MRRVLLLVLLVGSGCACEGGENMVAESWWGDVASLFSSHDDPVKVAALTAPPAYSGNALPAVPRLGQAAAPTTNP
jgi:hypothetical protein